MHMSLNDLCITPRAIHHAFVLLNLMACSSRALMQSETARYRPTIRCIRPGDRGLERR